MSHRRWFRFSLCTLLVLVLLASVPCAWLRMQLTAAVRERQATNWLERSENCVSLTWDDAEGVPIDRRFDVNRWRWLSWGWTRRLLGDELCRHVVQVRGLDRDFNTAMQHVKAFTQLRVLDLTNTSFSDSDAVHLADLKQLRTLYLHGTPITNQALVYVKDLHHLRILSLNGTHVDDAGMTHLEGLSSLTLLNIQKTGVTQQRAEKLQRTLPACRIEK